MSEKWTLKESRATDMSPTALFSLADAARGALVVMGTAGMVEEGVPGVGGWVGIPGG